MKATFSKKTKIDKNIFFSRSDHNPGSGSAAQQCRQQAGDDPPVAVGVDLRPPATTTNIRRNNWHVPAIAPILLLLQIACNSSPHLQPSAGRSKKKKQQFEGFFFSGRILRDAFRKFYQDFREKKCNAKN